jgi:SAM-dependent methyltransferase
MSPTAAPPVLDAYERLAAHYDLLTAGYDHRRWVAALDRLARRHGLPGRRVLDLGCGTGHAIGPLVDHGYDVCGCDLSPAMLELARARGLDAELFVADMRALPDAGPFDLVLCLDDAVNYLLGDEDLDAAFASVRRVLAPGGLLVFDVNTERTYRTAFAADRIVADGERLLAWRGHGLDAGQPAIARATIEIFERDEATDAWQHDTSTHVQRHWRAGELTSALREAGLEPVAALGQRTGAVLEAAPDPARHTKVVHVARAPRREVRPMIVEP